MGNKCEWISGKFFPCDGFEPVAMDGNNVSCCGCNTDISRPKQEEPLIVRSGGTWVAHFEGVDYLYVGVPGNLYFGFDSEPNFGGREGFNISWKPFSEITLDDEIIKLWPVCIFDSSGYLKERKAQIVFHNRAILDKYVDSFGDKWDHCRLATPHELQEDHIANKQ